MTLPPDPDDSYARPGDGLVIPEGWLFRPFLGDTVA